MKKKQLITMLAIGTVVLPFGALKVEAEETKEYESNGAVEFIPNLDPTDPVDPENPDPEKPVAPIDPTDPEGPNPGTQGPLSIDFASSLDFGKNRISNKDQTYFARAQKYQGEQKDTPNFVQISDNRGTNGGWTLTVKQEAQLTATTQTLNDVLTGAQIKLSAPSVNSNAQNVEKPVAVDEIALTPGVESVVTTAAIGAGSGTWATYWGAVEEVEERDEEGTVQNVNVTKDVQLSVPGATPKDAVKYQTKLVWTLTDVPGE
ncbi:WxL domain cell surface protein [Enterococcus sp. DIV0840]|uniref:WxL domain-containing protein n=2 Tax=Enterococcus TaxID=1350 RepID=UPI001A905379|nr:MULTISPECIES: WxL domain-containing protein [Enterococcus]MBO0433160.1 WxL domain-containing protein [Enterococcus sp. DIV0849a]MBO0473883.1 WxL domain-containing protein [Enterococcus ureasiticus]